MPTGATVTNTEEENELEAWARSDQRDAHPGATIRRNTPENRKRMRALIDDAKSEGGDGEGNR